ncbi:hypothetical protein [Haloquadratum walsbyi]|jgi:hypothetical protein|uniref:Glycine zipper-like domain-containing protein n=1 Tax=Haloquadratum walsbyi J07HQW2 TaxID=1238425 RepID=U1PMY8_9EURY|nr:hypothetical protein [Haloquadratum walsbyi]ERG95107.1 MAG: hypothetical protein J07HQW2_01553 [Haloquadratum walsbyi J07HQW2]
MAQDYASGTEQPSSETVVCTEEAERITHGDSSSKVEIFGLGVSVTILIGAVGGVFAMWVLPVDSAVPLFLGVGVGFILSPVIGLGMLWRQN